MHDDDLAPGELLVVLDAWIIQDGNYPDFFVGQPTRFALEFWALDPSGLVVGDGGGRSTVHAGEGWSDIDSTVVARDSDAFVMIDVGLLAYSVDTRLPTCEVGQGLRGRVGLGVDPFIYFEEHGVHDHVPPAVYTWAITGIWREQAPWIPVGPSSPRELMRDPDRLGWGWQDRTDAWADDEGRGGYLLRCRLEPEPTVRRP